MKLKKFLPLIDCLTKVEIQTQDCESDPAFTGSILDIPWIYLNMKITRPNEYADEPVCIDIVDGQPVMVINLLEEN